MRANEFAPTALATIDSDEL